MKISKIDYVIAVITIVVFIGLVLGYEDGRLAKDKSQSQYPIESLSDNN